MELRKSDAERSPEVDRIDRAPFRERCRSEGKRLDARVPKLGSTRADGLGEVSVRLLHHPRRSIDASHVGGGRNQRREPDATTESHFEHAIVGRELE